MSTTSSALPPLDHLLPESILGATTSVVPLRMGLSGAGVYAVTSARGEYVLRVESQDTDRSDWTRQLRVWRRAAGAGVAPPIIHVDEGARAVVSAHGGMPLPTALADANQRSGVIGSAIAQLRMVHALDATDVAIADPVVHARAAWDAQRRRPGFPEWAAGLDRVLDDAASHLADDQRRVVSHNDMNPGNALWDGSRVWLVDWAVAGLTHPFYDVATFTTFLDLDAPTAFALLAAQEERPLAPSEERTFVALRNVVAVGAGSVFLAMVPDLTDGGMPAAADVPTLTQFYAQLRMGALDLSTATGRRAFGLALLRRCCDPSK